MNHGFGDVEALPATRGETAPLGHPAQGPLDDPAPRQRLEAGFMVAATDDFQREVTVSAGVEQFCASLNTIAEQMLEPRLALADGGLGSGWRFARFRRPIKS